MASILESTEIKRLWPSFNQSQKQQEDVYGIYMYEDQSGYLRLAIDKKHRHSQPVYSFHYKIDGYAIIKRWMKQFELCPRLCFIQTSEDECEGIKEQYCKGACEKKEAPLEYNTR